MITLKSTYTELKGQFEALQGELNTLKEAHSTLTTNFSQLEVKYNELLAKPSSVDAEAFAKAKTDLEAANLSINELTDKEAKLTKEVETLKAEAQSASAKALEITQSQGVPALNVKPESNNSEKVENSRFRVISHLPPKK
jgi:predicted nuclease with TOPRIM domain